MTLHQPPSRRLDALEREASLLSDRIDAMHQPITAPPRRVRMARLQGSVATPYPQKTDNPTAYPFVFVDASFSPQSASASLTAAVRSTEPQGWCFSQSGSGYLSEGTIVYVVRDNDLEADAGSWFIIGGPTGKVRHAIVVNASNQLQPTFNRKWVGTLYAKETTSPTADLVGGEPTLTIRVPHRKRADYVDPDGSFCPSRFFLPDGSRIAFSESADGSLILVSDYDEWERYQLYFGKVVDASGSTSGVNPADTRNNSGVGLPKEVRLLVIDSGTGNPLGAPYAGKKVWAQLGASAAASVTVGTVLAFRSYLGSPLNENLAIWDLWGESTTGLVVVSGEPGGVGPCVAIECQATVGTREVSDDHTGEMRIRRGKTTADDANKRRRELRLGVSMRGMATTISGKPDLAGLKLPGLPPKTIETFVGGNYYNSLTTAANRLRRHLVVQGAQTAESGMEFVELDWTAPGITGFSYKWSPASVTPINGNQQVLFTQHWTQFDRGIAVAEGNGTGQWRLECITASQTGDGTAHWTTTTPPAASTEPWPNNCCDT